MRRRWTTTLSFFIFVAIFLIDVLIDVFGDICSNGNWLDRGATRLARLIDRRRPGCTLGRRCRFWHPKQPFHRPRRMMLIGRVLALYRTPDRP